MSALVSIIVPVYNAEKLLKRAVERFLAQDYKNIEVLLIDDGSTDGSAEIGRGYAKKDSRVRVFSQENQGAAGARNTGIELAEGEFFYFPDADDELRSDAIRKLVDAMDADTDLVICGYDWINGKGSVVSEKTYEPARFEGEYIRTHYDEFSERELPYGIYGAMWNKLYRADIIRKNSITVPKLRRSEDEIFNMEYLTYVRSVRFIGDVLYKYYISDIGGNSRKYMTDYLDTAIRFKNCQLSIIKKWGGDNEKALERICSQFAVRIDFYIRMIVCGDGRALEKHRRIKEAARIFNRELPERKFRPDFLKYKLLLGGRAWSLYFVHLIKELKLRRG